MAICKDQNDQIERNSSLVTNLNDISFDGTLRPSFATTAIEEYSRLVSADIQLNAQVTVINKFVNQYGKKAFDAGLNAINNTLINREVFQNNLSNYPDLQNRLKRPVPITPIEYANYMDEFLQNPNTVVNLVNSNTPLIQSQLNDFYRNNFTQSAIGSFCALMPSVFGVIDSFFYLVDDAQQAFQDIVDFINNFSLEDLAKKLTMKNLISKIKEQITKIIDDTVNKVKGIIENLSFENIIGQIETFVNNNIIKKFIQLKAQVLSFFSRENIENLKRKIENLFNYAASIFKDPSLEEIQFLVYRFCAFAGQIETAINLLKRPLDDFVDNYQTTYTILRSSGRTATSRAISEGGATRYSDEERKVKINNGKDREAAQPVTPAPESTLEELKDAGSISSFEAFEADQRFYIPDPPNRSWGSTQYQTKEEGWEMIYDKGQIDLVCKLIRLQKLFGKKLQINSAYRNEKLQSIVNRGTRGFHVDGKALDISWNGFNRDSAIQFCRIARRQCGFRGIGIYDKFIHVDIRGANYPESIFRDDLNIRNEI